MNHGWLSDDSVIQEIEGPVEKGFSFGDALGCQVQWGLRTCIRGCRYHSSDGSFCDSITQSTPQFDVLQWWEGMALRLPTMYPIARSILAIPHTCCDVERSLSVRSEKQHNMKEGTHKVYVSFCFNGVVPPS